MRGKCWAQEAGWVWTCETDDGMVRAAVDYYRSEIRVAAGPSQGLGGGEWVGMISSALRLLEVDRTGVTAPLVKEGGRVVGTDWKIVKDEDVHLVQCALHAVVVMGVPRNVLVDGKGDMWIAATARRMAED